MSEDSARNVHVDGVKISRTSVTLKLNTVDTRTASDELVNHYVFVDERHSVQPPPGSYFIHDVLGCSVFAHNKEIGTIVEVYTRSQGFAQDVWVVEGNGTVLWIPAVKDFLEEVDVARRRIIIRRAEELLFDSTTIP
jgi:16S rRNA processing protein RimM